jgi:hypothetical protein
MSKKVIVLHVYTKTEQIFSRNMLRQNIFRHLHSVEQLYEAKGEKQR